MHSIINKYNPPAFDHHLSETTLSYPTRSSENTLFEIPIIRRIYAKKYPNLKEQKIKLKFGRDVHYDVINYQKKVPTPTTPHFRFLGVFVTSYPDFSKTENGNAGS